MSLSAYLTSIADAIRAKKGTTDPINAQDFASEIASIEGGGGVSFITSDGLEFNCITSWEECLDSNGDVLLDENGAPLMSGKYGSFTVTVKDRLQDINELPAIEDVNNILVYKTPIKSTDTVCLVKSEPRKETIDVIPYSVTETEVTVVDAGGVNMSGVVVMAGHTTVASPITITETNITIYADADGEWVYYNDTWMPFTDVLPSEFDASTYKGMTTDAPTTSSTPGLYLHFNKYYSPREVAITNISEQYVAEGGSITISYVDELSDVTSPVVSQDDLNPVLYITPQKVYTYNGVKYEDWCETVLDSFFKGKTSEFPTKDSADGVYFVRSVTPVSFGIPTTNADIFQNIEGTWKQLGHRRVVDASKFPKPGETGVSGGGASSEKVDVIVGLRGDGAYPLDLVLSMKGGITSTTTRVDDHTAVTSPEMSTATNVIAYVDDTGVWAYDGESWVDVLKKLFGEDMRYFGVHTSMPDLGSADTWAFAFVSEQTNGSIWMAQGGVCVDMTAMLMLELGLRPTSWTVVSDHTEVTSPEVFDMAIASGPVYVDNTDVWAYVPDNGGWIGLVRDIMDMPEDYAFAILTEPPTADSPMGIYFVPVELSTEGGTVDPNFVPYDEDLIYKVTTKEGETNLYQVYDIGNGTINVLDERKYNAQFSGTLDFIFVEDHTTVEDPIISKELNSTTYYVDGNEIWYFANPGGWIRKCSSYSIVSEPPTVESAIGYYLIKPTEFFGIGVADPDVSVHQMTYSDPWVSVNFGGTIFDFIDLMSQLKDTTATSYKIVNDISEVTDTNFVYLIKNTQTVAYIDVNGNLDHITPAFAAEQGATYEVVSKRSEAVAVPNKIGYYACFGEQDWKDLTGTITTLEGQVEELGELKERVSTLEAENNSLTTEKANLETQVDTLTTEKTNLQSDFDATVPSMNFMNYAVLSGSEYGITLTSVTNTALESIKIHSSVTHVGDNAFDSCCNLTSVYIPNSVTRIENFAFYKCTSLPSVDIPNSVTTIERNAFFGCSKLTSVTIPDSVTTIGKYAFQNCTGLTSVIIGDGVTSIGSAAFSGCRKLTSVTIPDSVTSISEYMFQNCTGLTNVMIGDGVTSIGSAAFGACRSLTSITIPNSVTSIESGAFYDCSSLTNINIPNNVISIKHNTFTGCTSLTSITVSEENANYQSIDGNLYTKDGKVFFLYAIGKTDTSFAIPEGVTSIGENAFRQCTSLTSITIPNSVTSIDGYAFYDCSSLTNINIPNGVTEIGDWAFGSCSGLTSITIPDSVTSISDLMFAYCRSLVNVEIGGNSATIGESAFTGCTSLTSITIPNSVTSIDTNAFEKCTNLTSITFTGTMEQWNAITFGTDWNLDTGDYTIHCTDGDIAKES